jgi:hypothetical protein
MAIRDAVNTGSAVFQICLNSRNILVLKSFCLVEARVQKSSMCRDWKEIYKAALFEDDNSKIPQRIAEAERALAARASELYGASDDQIREQQAMENARYFLRVLGSTQGLLNTPGDYLKKQNIHLQTA